MKPTPVIVSDEYGGVRLDKFLQARFQGVTFTQIQKMCRKGNIRLNGSRVKANVLVEAGQEVRVPPFFHDQPEASKKPQLTPQDRELLEQNVIYQDEDMLVLNKLYGIPVQGGEKHTKSLDNMMKVFVEDKKARLTHRLDRDTTGCLVFALNRPVSAKIADAFKTKQVQKTYWAIVQGRLPQQEGTIKAPLKKVGKEGDQKMVVAEDGKRAVTHFREIASAGKNIHWLEVIPETGRTHQIRVHLAEMGTPIVGDNKYGEVEDLGDYVPTNKMFLHARSLVFNDSLSLKNGQFTADLPPHFHTVFKLFHWQEKQAETLL
jgi:23S rRNA pseudouridine955/2504/2580 synthase